VEHWDVEQGGTYDITISGVTECTGPSIEVIVKSSDTGNQTFTAYVNPAVDGEYSFTITMPNNACNTYPIEYCTTGGDPSTGYFARRNDGGDFQSHLRAADFGGNCSNTPTPITDCGGGQQTGSITACKFYDKNANGVQDPGEPYIANWPITITQGLTAIATTQTGSDGTCVTVSSLAVGSGYSVSEGTPIQNNWIHSTNTTQSTTVLASPLVTPAVNFGNYCTQPSGGLTLGFWSNKNGQALITSSDLTALTGLNLVNADGSAFNPTTKDQVKTWLLNAKATNMAYMLSAQLATMKLNVLHGFVDAGSFALSCNKTISQLMTEADASLAAHPNTTAAGQYRSDQEALKNCLDALNNGALVIPTTPCPYSF
jgi:hypothetical protein